MPVRWLTASLRQTVAHYCTQGGGSPSSPPSARCMNELRIPSHPTPIHSLPAYSTGLTRGVYFRYARVTEPSPMRTTYTLPTCSLRHPLSLLHCTARLDRMYSTVCSVPLFHTTYVCAYNTCSTVSVLYCTVLYALLFLLGGRRIGVQTQSSKLPTLS